MKRKILMFLTFLLSFLPGFGNASEVPDNLVEIVKTSNGVVYVDSESVTPITKDNKIYLLVTMEEHYNNPQYLAKLRSSDPKLKNATMRVFLYMFNNNGTQYCMPARFMADAEGKVCLDLGADLEMKSVNNSNLLVKVYETGYSVLERKQRSMNS